MTLVKVDGRNAQLRVDDISTIHEDATLALHALADLIADVDSVSHLEAINELTEAAQLTSAAYIADSKRVSVTISPLKEDENESI